MPVSKAKVREVALSFPGVVEKPSYGKPAFFIAKSFFARIRDDEGALVIGVEAMEQRDMLLELDPETYFITEHYHDYPYILVRLSKISFSELKVMLGRRWQKIAPKSLQRKEKIASRPAKAHPRGKPALRS
jgi:hypothetical protein